MRFELTDEEWMLLEPLMPSSRKSAGADDRNIMNAIFYVLRTGMPTCKPPAAKILFFVRSGLYLDWRAPATDWVTVGLFSLGFGFWDDGLSYPNT